jgi:D-tyrosyl-tRNA(Tyr) deacylase
MRAVLQRVSSARVLVNNETVGEIGRGLLVFVGVAQGDANDDVAYVAGTIRELRVFPDEQARMNRSVVEVAGAVLVVSQFTLLGDCRKGRRPSFDAAAPADVARSLYQRLVDELRRDGLEVQTGVFQAHMAIELVNDGPVTLLLDSRRDP